MINFFRMLILSVSLLATPALLAEVVNINKATAAALQENLRGVGVKKAQAIVAYRTEYGAFKTLDEIMEVKGIGQGIFKKIKADISLTKGITDLVGEKSANTSTSAKKKASEASAATTTTAKPAVEKKAAKKAVKKPTKAKKSTRTDKKAKKDTATSKAKNS